MNTRWGGNPISIPPTHKPVCMTTQLSKFHRFSPRYYFILPGESWHDSHKQKVKLLDLLSRRNPRQVALVHKLFFCFKIEGKLPLQLHQLVTLGAASGQGLWKCISKHCHKIKLPASTCSINYAVRRFKNISALRLVKGHFLRHVPFAELLLAVAHPSTWWKNPSVDLKWQILTSQPMLESCERKEILKNFGCKKNALGTNGIGLFIHENIVHLVLINVWPKVDMNQWDADVRGRIWLFSCCFPVHVWVSLVWEGPPGSIRSERNCTGTDAATVS